MGIEQLVEMYKGNPGPLEAKVEKDQQGQKPGDLPKDFEEALALQKIAELQQGAQNQQAMQAGGAQPSVVERLKQMLASAQQRQQAQPMPGQPPQFQPPQGQPPMPQGPQGGPPPSPQGQPVMAAHGGSIAQLVSNLGRHYAGGGIIAFTKGGNEGLSDEDRQKLEAQTAIYVAAAQQRAAEEAANAPPTPAPEEATSAAGDIWRALTNPIKNAASSIATAVPEALRQSGEYAKLKQQRDETVPGFFEELTPTQRAARLKQARELAAQMSQGQTQSNAAPNAEPTASVSATAPAYSDSEVEKLKRLAAARSQTGINTNPALQPRPTATVNTSGGGGGGGGGGNRVNTGGGTPSTSQQPAQDSLRALSEKYIREEMGLNPETESDKIVARGRKIMGLDELLAEKSKRADAREAAQKQIQGSRTPAWVEALSAAGRPVRGGIGTLLNQMGGAAESTRNSYAAQDLAFQKELDGLRDVITDAKINGNKELAKEGMAAYKEVDARRKAALTSATSLLNTDATTEASLQRAREAAAGRAQFAGAQLEERKAKRLQDQANFLSKLQLQHEGLLNKDQEYNGMVKQKQFLELQMTVTQDEAKRAKLADQLEAQQAKMAAYATSKIGGGTAGAANIPPPPPNAVREVKKS